VIVSSVCELSGVTTKDDLHLVAKSEVSSIGIPLSFESYDFASNKVLVLSALLDLTGIELALAEGLVILDGSLRPSVYQVDLRLPRDSSKNRVRIKTLADLILRKEVSCDPEVRNEELLDVVLRHLVVDSSKVDVRFLFELIFEGSACSIFIICE
jgi:hypothetical protein